MGLKHVIPLQRIEQINIECKNYNLETDYFNFEIDIKGVTDTKIRLTGETINKINNEVNKMIDNIKKGQ